jgi:hypothetical protein
LFFGESFLYTLHLFKEDFAAENRISESFAAAPSTEIKFIQNFLETIMSKTIITNFRENITNCENLSIDNINSSAAAPSTEISVPSIVFELKFLSLLCISVEHNANRNFSDDSSDQIKFEISIQILLKEQRFQWMVQQQSSLKFYFLQQNPL